MKQLQKYIYQYAYYYAVKCQKKFFMLYMLKYINKHIKYQIQNENEYDVLVSIIANRSQICTETIREIQNEKNILCDYLYNENALIYKKCRANYSYRLKDMDTHIENTFNKYALKTIISNNSVLKDIVSFSLQFQDVFDKSCLTAKTKAQEHWFMRLPSYVLCLTLVLLIKLFDFERNEFSYVSLCLILTAYILSIYLVIIRFHQSVLADTKKLCSELYSKHKMKLFRKILHENI